MSMRELARSAASLDELRDAIFKLAREFMNVSFAWNWRRRPAVEHRYGGARAHHDE